MSSDTEIKKKGPVRRKPADGNEFAMMVVKVRLDPNKAQRAQLESHFGANRLSYNVAIAEFRRQGNKENPVPAVEKFKNWSPITVRNFVNRFKSQWSWAGENSKMAYDSGARAAADAIGRFFKGQCRYPRFRKRGDRESYTVDDGKAFLLDTENKLHVPRVGKVRISEKMGKHRRKARKLGATTQTVTISRCNGVYYASIVYRYERKTKQEPTPSRKPERYLGIDLNVNGETTIVVANALGEEVAVYGTPAELRVALEAKKQAQRALSRKQGPTAEDKNQPKSNNYVKQEKAVARCQRRVNDLMSDWRHQVSTDIVNNLGAEVITLETLDLKAMMKGFKGVRRHLAFLGLGELVEQVLYKAVESGILVHRVDKWFPSSKKCSNCDLVKAKLGLDERWYYCGECGLFIHRDLNSAGNLVMEGYSQFTGSQSVRSGKHSGSATRHNAGVLPYLGAGLTSPTGANHP